MSSRASNGQFVAIGGDTAKCASFRFVTKGQAEEQLRLVAANVIGGDTFTARQLRASLIFHVTDESLPIHRHPLRAKLSPRYRRYTWRDVALSMALGMPILD